MAARSECEVKPVWNEKLTLMTGYEKDKISPMVTILARAYKEMFGTKITEWNGSERETEVAIQEIKKERPLEKQVEVTVEKFKEKRREQKKKKRKLNLPGSESFVRKKN